MLKMFLVCNKNTMFIVNRSKAEENYRSKAEKIYFKTVVLIQHSIDFKSIVPAIRWLIDP